jgi:hypothetical protein
MATRATETVEVNIETTDRAKAFAQAIAHQEGFYVFGSIPHRANNPGDLVIPGWTGLSLGRERISVLKSDSIEEPFPPDGGWFRLLHELWLIESGRSHVYTLDMTILEMAHKWTDTQQDDWARNVAGQLGVPPETTLRQVLVGD